MAEEEKGLLEGLEYARSQYLLFGYKLEEKEEAPEPAEPEELVAEPAPSEEAEHVPPEGVLPHLDLEGCRRYLTACKFESGNLTQARKKIGEKSEFLTRDDGTTHVCDFCGKVMEGEFVRLKDGRERCMECSATVLKKPKDYELLMNRVRAELEKQFGISIPVTIAVKIVSQKKLAKICKDDFTATNGFDARTLGVAIKYGNSYHMCFENGSPRLSLIATCAHELTHIWQYTHWDDDSIGVQYGDLKQGIYEGMAKWAELQYLYLINEKEFADRYFKNEVARSDVYGFGLRMFLKQYSMTKGLILSGPTPFDDPKSPLDLQAVLGDDYTKAFGGVPGELGDEIDDAGDEDEE